MSQRHNFIKAKSIIRAWKKFKQGVPLWVYTIRGYPARIEKLQATELRCYLKILKIEERYLKKKAQIKSQKFWSSATEKKLFEKISCSNIVTFDFKIKA